MKKRTPYLDVCGQRMRYVLIIGNCIFAMLGLAVIAGGVYLSIDRLYFVSVVFGVPILASASYLIIAAGCIIFVISFGGCFGAIFENRVLLLIYAIFLSLAFVLAIICAILAIVFRSWIQDQVRTYMTSTITYDYGVKLDKDWNNAVTKAWDEAQQRWYCCGVDDQSWGVYRGSSWFQAQPGIIDVSRPYVPLSCCKKNQYGEFINPVKCQTWVMGPPGRQSGVTNEFIFYSGCYVAGKDLVFQLAGYLVGIGIVVALIVLGGIVTSLILFRQL